MKWSVSINAGVKQLTIASALLGSCLMAINVSAQSPQEFSRTVIETNPEIKAKLYEFLASSQDLRQARGSYMPSVDISATTGRVDREGNIEEFDRSQVQLSVTQLLFDGFRVRHEVGQASEFELVRYYEFLDTADQIMLEGLQSYYDVIRYQQLVDLAQANYENHERVHGQIQERVDSGLSTSADLNQISGRLALAESNLLTEESNLYDVTQRYIRLSGTSPGQPVATEMNLNLPQSIDDVLDVAYAQSPAFHAAVTGIRAADEGVGMRRSRYMPTVEVRARHTRNDNLNGLDRLGPDNGNENVVELIFNYNLFRGNSDRAATRAAYERANRARSLRDKACVDIRQTASIAFNDVRNIRSQLQALTLHRDNSINVAQAYQEQFSIGQRGLLDVLDAQNESFQARRAVVQAEYDLLLAQLRVVTVMGDLRRELGVSRSDLPPLSELSADPVQINPANACMR